MDEGHRRIRREKRTIEAMVRIYCRAMHAGACAPCPECAELLGYARMRLDRCRYGRKKPTCGKCPAHCYRPSMKQRVIEVMTYSGPRMTWRHPLYALMHLLDSLREPPSGRGPE